MSNYDFSNKLIWSDNPQSPAAEVYVKQDWADEWSRRYDMIPVQSTWSINPQMPTATLEYRYGEVVLPGTSRVQNLVPITARGYYVLIKWYTDTEVPMYWLGTAETPVKEWELDTDGTTATSGLQVIPCYGLEAALKETFVNTTIHRDVNPEDPSYPWKRSGSAAVFNPDPERGNRTGTAIGINAAIGNRHVFETPRADSREFWTTRDIVDYLMTFHLPTTDYGITSLPWRISPTFYNYLPDWDRPTVEADERSVYNILNELLETQRMLGWFVGAEVSVAMNGSPVIDYVELVPFARSATAINLPGVGSMPGNAVVHTINSDQDPLTTVNIDEDDSQQVDEVIVQGPREVAVCTLAAGAEIDTGWTLDQQTKYDEGASTDPDWGTLKPFEQWEANSAARQLANVEDVYALFVVADDWDGKANRDESGATPTDVFEPNKDEDDNDVTYVPYLGNVEMLEILPLFEGIKYTGDIANVNETSGKSYKMPILMFDRDPRIGSQKFIDAVSKTRMPANFLARNGNMIPITLKSEPDNQDGPGFRIEVEDGPRHAIASSFVGNAADKTNSKTRLFGDITYSNMRITCALVGDRRPSWTIKSGTSADTVRRRVITMEDPSLMHVRIAKGTVLDLTLGGQFKTSNGGTLRDPGPQLQALCKLAAATYLNTRKSVRVSTKRRISGIFPGSILKTANGVSADAVVREVRIDAPSNDGRGYDAVVQTIRASTNEFDIVDLMGRTAGDDIVRHSNVQKMTAKQMGRIRKWAKAVDKMAASDARLSAKQARNLRTRRRRAGLSRKQPGFRMFGIF